MYNVPVLINFKFESNQKFVYSYTWLMKYKIINQPTNFSVVDTEA